MAMNEQNCLNALIEDLSSNEFFFPDKIKNKKFLELLIKHILTEVKKGTISVPALGLNAPPNGGPVTGSANGTIS